MKKLLIASSALAVTAPAFAQEVTLSGTFVGKATTEDLTQLSGHLISTLIFGLAYEGETVGGNINFGETSSIPNVGEIVNEVGSANIYAMTSFGKFNYGTSDGDKTDDDLIELSIINDECKRHCIKER